jgi:hypothetical protein
MTAMHAPAAGPIVLALTVALAVAACAGATGPSAPDAATSAPVGSTTEAAATLPPATAVPGAQTGEPEPVPTRTGTTQTTWGEILDAVPESFPLFPGADVIDLGGEPVSTSFDAPADASTVAAWYVDSLAGLGYAVELSAALEDGTQVLDAAADLPECRIQMTFRPESGSAIITVLYAAACAGLGG